MTLLNTAVAPHSRHESAWLKYYASPERRHDNLNIIMPEALQDAYEALMPGAVIVDVGCGNGRLIPGLLMYGDLGYHGIDISPQQLEFARERFPAHRFELCSMLDMGRRYPGRFDGFYCGSMLMCLERSRVPEALRALAASLKGGAPGVFIVGGTTTATAELEGATAQFYSPLKSVQLIEDAGFRIWNMVEIASGSIIWAKSS